MRSPKERRVPAAYGRLSGICGTGSLPDPSNTELEAPLMKEDRRRKLVQILGGTDSWISSSQLAGMLGVSERTIRNYVSELSETYAIESSRAGYRIAGPARRPGLDGDSGSVDERRVTHLLTRLLSSESTVSVFDVASELNISPNTLTNSVIPHCRRLLERFDVALENHEWELTLAGAEQAKRKLLGYVATHDTYGYFSSTETLSAMFPEFDTDAILSELVNIFQREDLVISDYALNNLLVHLLVIIIRIEGGYTLDGANDLIDVEALISEISQRERILRCANDVVHLVESSFKCMIPERDYRQILLLVSLSCDRYDYSNLSDDKLANILDATFLDDVRSLTERTASRYGLPPFSRDFTLQLTLHAHNAFQRAEYNVSCPNPIAQQIKTSYAAVYDMAVYFAHGLQSAYDVSFSEDEIAFIAYHIGAYIEKNRSRESAFSCVVVVERYHDYAQMMVEKLSQSFSEELASVDAIDYQDYVSKPPAADLLVTTIDFECPHPHHVLVSPLMGKRDVRLVRNEIEAIERERERMRSSTFLRSLFDPNLYVRNRHFSSVDECIDYLGALCKDEGFVDQEFVEDVKIRERVSSTAFTDELAVPHSIGRYADHSFACVLHDDQPLTWGAHKVRIVLLIGLSRQDMKHFSEAFGIIIERFSDVDSTARILSSDSFDEFVASVVEGA